MRNKRAFLAGGLRRIGLLKILERAARRPGLLVLCYHRIGNPANDLFYAPIFSATADRFDAQLTYIHRHFRLLTLDEVVEAAERGFRLDGPCALITFDDGYRDNLEAALPVLQRHNAPAAFFLPTGFLDRPRLFWWDHVAYVLKQTERTRVELEVPRRLSLDLIANQRDEAVFALVQAYLRDDAAGEERFLSHLEERAGVAVDVEALGRDLFLTWDQACALPAAGMAIGSHTETHPRLARLSEAEQGEEMSRSKLRLEQELRRSIVAVAYPFGGTDSYDETTMKQAREAGYRLGFGFRGGVNRPGSTRAFDVARVHVGFDLTMDLFRARVALSAAAGSSFL